MDKTKLSHYTVRTQSAFAMMITFSVLLILISLTMVLLSYFNQVRDDAEDTTAMIQANVYYADIVNTFDKFKNKKDLFTKLYSRAVIMDAPSKKFKMFLTCKSLSSGVNINWLGKENIPSMQEAYSFIQLVFDTLAQEYQLSDISKLKEMLLEEMGGEKPYIEREYSRLRQKKGIISYEQFATIVTNYQIEVDDPRASTVPWEKYFTFSNDATVIDAEYSSPELLSLLFDIYIDVVRAWYGDPKRPSLESFVNENGGEYKSKKNIIAGQKFLGESKCTVSYKSLNKDYTFKFKYIKGAAKHFEFYGKN